MITKRISQAAQSRQPCVNSHQLSQWEPMIFDPIIMSYENLNVSITRVKCETYRLVADGYCRHISLRALQCTIALA